MPVSSGDIRNMFAENPVVAAIKDSDGLSECLNSQASVIFVLFGDILNISGIVARIKQAGKTAFVHLDLIDGLAPKEVSVRFIKRATRADGVISTRPQFIKWAHDAGFLTVQRCFVIDSMALNNLKSQCEASHADFIEVMPNVYPQVLKKITAASRLPVIVGGLVSEPSEVRAAVSSGAVAVSTTCTALWDLKGGKTG